MGIDPPFERLVVEELPLRQRRGRRGEAQLQLQTRGLTPPEQVAGGLLAEVDPAQTDPGSVRRARQIAAAPGHTRGVR